jgi:hypothetical protein
MDFRELNRDDIIENFSDRNIYTLFEQENKNINTKSYILAPFNSSLKSDSENLRTSSLNYTSSFSNKSLKVENNAIKFIGKVKELNRNYELNNNGEIDNGIIISAKSNIYNYIFIFFLSICFFLFDNYIFFTKIIYII